MGVALSSDWVWPYLTSYLVCVDLAETFVPRPSLHLASQSSSEEVPCETDGGVADGGVAEGEKDKDKLLQEDDNTFTGLLGVV